jgi:quercetin dioxygenase-like cupin family protein
MSEAKPVVVAAEGGQNCSVLGSVTRIVLDAGATGGGMTLVEITDKPGGGVPLHVHEREDETFMVVEGEVEFTVDGHATVGGPGTVMWGPRKVPHAFRMVGDAPSRIFVAITPSGMEGMFKELHALPSGPPDPARVAEICGRYGIRFL